MEVRAAAKRGRPWTSLRGVVAIVVLFLGFGLLAYWIAGTLAAFLATAEAFLLALIIIGGDAFARRDQRRKEREASTTSKSASHRPTAAAARQGLNSSIA